LDKIYIIYNLSLQQNSKALLPLTYSNHKYCNVLLTYHTHTVQFKILILSTALWSWKSVSGITGMMILKDPSPLHTLAFPIQSVSHLKALPDSTDNHYEHSYKETDLMAGGEYRGP
jgi:hypothetical protein